MIQQRGCSAGLSALRGLTSGEESRVAARRRTSLMKNLDEGVTTRQLEVAPGMAAMLEAIKPTRDRVDRHLTTVKTCPW